MVGTLSVIMSNYNHGHHLNQSLTAILEQSHPPTEFIIIDDGSTDDSFECLERFAKAHPCIRLLRNPRNIGPVENYQRALNLATCDYVYGASADDMVLPGFFERCIPVLDDHPEAGLVHCDFETMDGRVNNFFPLNSPCYFSPHTLIRQLRKSGHFTGGGANSIFRRTSLLEVGGLRPELKWHCDSVALVLIALRHGACYVPGSHVAIRVALDSYSRGGSRNDKVERELLEQIIELIGMSQFDDIRPRLAQALVWPITCPELLPTIYKNEKYKCYRSFSLIARACRVKLRSEIVHFVPLSFKRWWWVARNGVRRFKYTFISHA